MTQISPHSHEPLPDLERKTAVTVVLLVAVVLALLVQFWRLQISQNDKYQRLADNNRIRLVDMQATRGIVTDLNGVILADSRPLYNIAVVPEDMEKDREAELAALTMLLGRDLPEALARLHDGSSGGPYRQLVVLENLEEEEVALFESERDRFPGASMVITPRRFYPFGETAAHLLGYVGEISRSALDSGQFPGAKSGDLVGKYGMEKVYDQYLRGRDGGRQVEVDAVGREISVLGLIEPVPGANLKLTLDVRLQQELEAAMTGLSGAGVVLDVGTGAVLAMSSRPSFDPNEFSLRMSRERWASFLNDPDHPLTNRVTQGVYPPGSTFKLVTGVASLMEGTLDPDSTLVCPGYYNFGRRTYRDWKPQGHGRMNFFRAVVESCDVYFYQAGEKAGIDSLWRWGTELGLGRRTGIDLPGESAGLMPSSGWKLRERKEPWFPGETLSASIGQGYVLVTPLQLANLYATAARRGEVKEPFIVARVEDVRGRELYRRDPTVNRETPVNAAAWQRIVRALEGVVNDEKGTGRAALMKRVVVAGKTGTAQVVRMEEWQDRPEEEIPQKLRDHAWFAAFAPVDDPKVAAAVVVEHGGHGASAAAPVVARVFRRYFQFQEDRMPAENGGEGADP